MTSIVRVYFNARTAAYEHSLPSRRWCVRVCTRCIARKCTKKYASRQMINLFIYRLVDCVEKSEMKNVFLFLIMYL